MAHGNQRRFVWSWEDVLSFKNEISKLDPIDLKKISFNGLQVLTDAALYLLYKYKRHESADQWSHLESISLDSCPYITDFGIELIAMATQRPNLIKPNESCGCKNLFKYLHMEVPLDGRVNDIFQSHSFTKCFEQAQMQQSMNLSLSENKIQPNALPLNAYKMVILNSSMSEISVLNYLRQIFTLDIPPNTGTNSLLQTKLQREKIVSDFEKLKLSNIKLNILELDSVRTI